MKNRISDFMHALTVSDSIEQHLENLNVAALLSVKDHPPSYERCLFGEQNRQISQTYTFHIAPVVDKPLAYFKPEMLNHLLKQVVPLQLPAYHEQSRYASADSPLALVLQYCFPQQVIHPGYARLEQDTIEYIFHAFPHENFMYSFLKKPTRGYKRTDVVDTFATNLTMLPPKDYRVIK
jgi:hypothetical protein